MRRLGLVLVFAAALTFVGGSGSEAQACKLLKMLFHRCHACHYCGHYKCHFRKCHRPKCHCGEHSHHGFPPPAFYGPAYPEQAAPRYEERYERYEELAPPGRAF